MTALTYTWDGTIPNGQQGHNLLGSVVRNLKTQIRELLATDHIMESSGSGATWGYHKKITFTNQDDTVIGIADNYILYAKPINSDGDYDTDGEAELFGIDEDDNEIQLTSGGSWVAGFASEIRMYSGLIANIPAGWALADGVSGRPLLIDRMLKGIATDATEPGTFGGSDTAQFSSANIPAAHTHVSASVSAQSHTHNYALLYVDGITIQIGPISHNGLNPSGADTHTSGSAAAHTHTASAASTGGSTVFSVVPAYCTLAYIVKT